MGSDSRAASLDESQPANLVQLDFRPRMRRRAPRSRLTSVRTAARNFDLELATATLRLPGELYVGTEAILVVHGGNRAGPYFRFGSAAQIGVNP